MDANIKIRFSDKVLKIKLMTWVEHKFITAGLAAQITYDKSITATHTLEMPVASI